VFLLSLFVLALFAALSPAWAADSGGAAPSSAAVAAAPTPAPGCAPALDLASANSCPAPALALPADLVPLPDFMHNKHLGYCHCGCGPATCRTSADCGGASCDQFISCC
jgi:hypothetical protein